MASVHLVSDVFPAIPPLALAGLLSALQPRLLQPLAPEACGENSSWVARVQQPQPTPPSPARHEAYEVARSVVAETANGEARQAHVNPFCGFYPVRPDVPEPDFEVKNATDVVRPEVAESAANQAHAVVRPEVADSVESEANHSHDVVRPEGADSAEGEASQHHDVVRPAVVRPRESDGSLPTLERSTTAPARNGAQSQVVDEAKVELQSQDPLRPQESSEGPPTLERSATVPAGRQEQPVTQTAPKCDKCDGPHETDACPHFQKAREKHKDAWANYGRRRPPSELSASGGNFVLRGGSCVPQPGDGSCLFHSLSFGLNGGRSGPQHARELRAELASFIERNPTLEIAGDTVEEWVGWDANTTVSTYASRMAVSGWGGGIEMAACSRLKKVNVHVYESRWFGGHKRISCFDYPEPTERTIHVLYRGGMHYDALVPP